MDRLQEIIYDLLYDKKEEMVFNLSGMKDHIEDYYDLIEEISTTCLIGGVHIVKDIICVDGESVIWNLKINRDK